MKISSGQFRHKAVLFQPNEATRPTKLRIRQAIFNTLRHRFDLDFAQVSVLDAFAGSGALGFEAASLGASSLTFVEKDRRNAEVLRHTLQQLGLERRAHVLVGDVCEPAQLPAHSLQQQAPYGLVFLDPPYFQGLLPKVLERLWKDELVDKNTILVVECHKSELEDFSNNLPNVWSLQHSRCYGKIAISYLSAG